MTRLDPKTVEKALFSSNSSSRALGRLLSTQCFTEFEKWLDAEAIDSPAKATDALKVVISFSTMIISGVLSDNFKASPTVQEAALNIFLDSWRAINEQH